MESELKYWDILCEKHKEVIFRKKINTQHITEKNLIEFMRTLISKYALSDEEILEQYITIPFKKKKNNINIQRSSSYLNKPLSIVTFYEQVAGISVTASLTD
jgi:hypothetical protein